MTAADPPATTRLKESYYRTAVTNLQRLDHDLAQDLRLVDVDALPDHPAPARAGVGNRELCP